MQSDIKNIKLGFKCDADWNSMPAANGGRHCNSCQKTVYDFTDAKANEFLQILAENNNNVCGRFKAAQMAPVRVPIWQKWTSAALVLIGINVLVNNVFAQGKIRVIEKQATKPTDVEYTGMFLAPQAEFPGGQAALTKFLSKNIRYGKGAVDGKVFVSFTVKKDGVLGDVKIVRKLNPVNDEEVLRVIKLSPKWKPAKQNGKSFECRYTLPVNFSKV